MLTCDELQACIALNLIPGMGDVHIKKCISAMGSAREVILSKAAALEQLSGFGSFLSSSLVKHRKEAMQRAEQELKFIEANRIMAWVYYEKEYPRRLKLCADGPVVLYAAGNIQADVPFALGVVGTRNITPYGIDCTQAFLSELMPWQPLIVSGLAYGVDIHAHRAALENGLQTIAAVAHGLDKIYPGSHKKYVRRMYNNGGLVSDFNSGTIPDRENFVKRNRIVAGMVDAVLVIESAIKGGALITADLAQGYNRDVLAVPGKVGQSYSVGCNQLIRNHQAALVTSGTEVAQTLLWPSPEEQRKKKDTQAQLFAVMTPEEEKLVKTLLPHESLHVDILSEQTGITIARLNGIMLTLELKGMVKSLPGSRFSCNVYGI
ncbi:MAG: DNA-processing protein DprA [Bacteroidota bacterium]